MAADGERVVFGGCGYVESPASAAKISHNNVSEECVYVSTVDSQWKLGGFETATHFKKMDASVSCYCYVASTVNFLCIQVGSVDMYDVLIFKNFINMWIGCIIMYI